MRFAHGMITKTNNIDGALRDPQVHGPEGAPRDGDVAPWALGDKMRLNSQARVRALKAGVALAALMGAALAAPGFAAAQTATAGPADDQVEAVVVTGSRIQRKDISSVGPLSTLTSEDIKYSGASSIG